MWVTWIADFDVEDKQEPPKHHINVHQDIITVCKILKPLGAKVRITKVDMNTDMLEPEEVQEEEVTKEEDDKDGNILYQLEIDLSDADISVRGFNKLLRSWGIFSLSY